MYCVHISLCIVVCLRYLYVLKGPYCKSAMLNRLPYNNNNSNVRFFIS